MKTRHFNVARLFGCAATAVAAHTVDAQSESDNTFRGAIEEVIVTRSKVEQSLSNLSASISVVSEETLDDINAQSLSDYITRVPGVVFNDYQPGVSEVVIRGVASTTYHEATQTTTGYYLNEIPLIEPGFPLVIPDVDAFDLKRVEVLRGPQGTLFGSSSLGGAINYVVNEADTRSFGVGIEAGLSSTKGVDEEGHSIKGMLNLPIIEDQLAVRLVGLERFDSGYLDNPLLGEEGSNDLTVQGARGSIVYTPSESTTLKVLSMYQKYSLDDQTYVIFNDDPETFERNTNVAETQDTDFELHSIRLNHEFSFATFSALWSYVEKTGDLIFDYSIFGGNDPRTDTPLLASGYGESTTDYLELRLASNSQGAFDWQFGVNFTKLESHSTDALHLEGISDYIDANPDEFDGQTGNFLAPDDLAERTNNTNDVSEKALFGELTYPISAALSVTVGGRFFQYETQPTLEFSPNADLIEPFNYAPEESDESGFVPKVAVRYEPNDTVVIYASYSEGFRLGGVNVYSVAHPELPLTFDSDSTTNYEVGTRLDLFDNKLKLSSALYHIDWEDMQARLFTPEDLDAYTVNSGGAEIDGVEITVDLSLTDALSISSSISYNDAELSEPLPISGDEAYPAGSQLPGASDLTLANAININLNSLPLQPTVSVNHRYVSEAPVAFGAELEKGDFHLYDLNATAVISEQFEASFFVKNLTDEYGVLNAPFSFAGSVVRPRTVGVSLRYDLK